MTSDKRWRSDGVRYLTIASWSVVGFFCVLPVAALVATAIAPSPGGMDPARLVEVWTSRSATRALVNTLVIGVVSAGAATLVGTAVAIALAITNVRGKRAIAMLLVGALLVAPQVMALAFKTMAGPASPLLHAFDVAPPIGSPNPMLGLGGVILVITLHHVALAAMTVAAGLSSIPNSLIEAATVDGARPTSIVWRVLLPLVRPQIAASFVITFVAGAGNFGIPALLGLPVGVHTLPTLIYRQLSGFGPGVLPDVAALALLAALIAIAGVAVGRAFGREAVEMVPEGDTLKPFFRLGSMRTIAESSLWLLVALATLLPLFSLAATALVPAAGVRLTLDTVTLANLSEILFTQAVTTRALGNSLIFASVAGFIVTLFGFIIAYTLERSQTKGRGVLALLVQVPYAVPGIVVAIAAILILLRPLPILNFSLYGTSAIIVLAYIARFLAVAVGPIAAQIAQLDRDLEAAAMVCGAGLWQRLRHIVGPLMLPAMAISQLLVMLLAFNELTVSALLWSAGTETLGVALLSLEDAGLIGPAAALALVTTIFIALLISVIDRLGRFLPPGALPWATLAGR